MSSVHRWRIYETCRAFRPPITDRKEQSQSLRGDAPGGVTEKKRRPMLVLTTCEANFAAPGTVFKTSGHALHRYVLADYTQMLETGRLPPVTKLAHGRAADSSGCLSVRSYQVFP